jgi:Protein of unknown function (DUF3710)
VARVRGSAALAAATSTGGQSALATQRLRVTTNGPHDVEALDAQFVPAPGTVDFGAVKVPIPADGSVVVEPSAAGRMQAVHVSVPEGRLSVSALASPRNEGLWPDLVTEIDASLREGGARVRSFTGEWGRELHATTNGATSVFVGVDGPRWMLYGVATGPTRDAVALDARLRRMLRGTVVVRGKAPYPVRTVLPLTATSQLDGEAQGTPSAAPTMMLRAPASNGAALNGAGTNTAGTNTAGTNGAGTNGAGTNGVGAATGLPNGVSKTGGAPQIALPRGADTNGAPQTPAAAANGAAYGVPGTGPAPHGPVSNGTVPNGAVAASHGPWVGGASPDRAAPALGAGPYNTGANGVNGHRPATNGAGPDTAAATGGHPNGPVTNGAQSTGVPVNGWNPPAAPPSSAPPYIVGDTATPSGTGNGLSAYGAQPPAGTANGVSAYGAAPTQNPTSTGGTPRRGVPTGWAHDTGNHRGESSAGGLSAAPSSAPQPPPPAAVPAFPVSPERPWEPSAPAGPLPHWETSEPLDLAPQPAAPQYSADRPLGPVESFPERRSSWADPDDARGTEPAPAPSPSHWDPLSDPLPGGLDPLPEPVPTWSEPVSAPPERWQAEAVGVDAPPDAGTPLFDEASAFSARATERSYAGTPLYEAASSTEGPPQRSAPPDVGTPLFDATSAWGTPRRSADPAARVPSADAGTPLYEAASASSRWSTERSGQAADPPRLGDSASEAGGRRRRDPGVVPQDDGTSRLDLPRRTRRHGQPGDEPLSAVPPSAGMRSYNAGDDARPGRRRAPETPTTSTGRHGAETTPVRHRDDTPVRHRDDVPVRYRDDASSHHRDDASVRHGDAENRHAAHHGPSPRVPPTQWAWPKEETPGDGSPHEAPSGRRAADTEPTTWSAAELLDARNDGGRRRRSEAARHGHSGDPESGRHYRP